jgi:4-hydroxythreonine-4-phosphate dehydrogenase
MMRKLPILAITCGEPAGVGPEIALRSAWQLRLKCRSVLIGDIDFLRALAHQIDAAIVLNSITDLSQLVENELAVMHVPLACPVVPGQLDLRNGLSVLATLDLAIEGTMKGEFDAIVTAPLQKSIINDAGVLFSGHTEYLAEKTQTKKVVMMLVSSATATQTRPLRVALVTTHLPLRAVADAITFDELSQILTILHNDLKNKFGINKPVILVTGLNPHAGEHGYLGREEIDVITPAIVAAQERQIDARGPYPADTLFQEKYLNQADCVLAMYHDQGLPVLKYSSFGMGVNVTLGLPIIRTSVDHGPALDIAVRGIGIANVGSMLEAIELACQMTMTTYP